MATQSSDQTPPFGSGFSPLMGQPRMGLVPIPQKTPLEVTLTTAGGARTLTTDEVLGGLLVFNVDDAQTATLPTAALLNAAVPAAKVGASFDVDVINIGDTTLTVAIGTGGTLVVGNSKSTVATVATNAAKRFTIRITEVNGQDGGTTDSYLVYGFGSTAAAVA
jgi:hypothetical protein